MPVGELFEWGLSGGSFSNPTTAGGLAVNASGLTSAEVDAFGVDVACFPDLSPTFQLITGLRVLAEALARRFTTIRGALFYAPNYGYDLRLLLNTSIDDGRLFDIRQTIEREAEKDERVIAATATVAFSLETMTLTIGLTVTTSAGPFRLTLAVTQATVAVLHAEAA